MSTQEKVDTAAKLLARAKAIAVEAHTGQTDKSGQAYIWHVTRVAAGVDTVLDQIVAWLHDVIEDTEWTREALDAEATWMTIEEAIIWHNLIADVALLTKIKGMSNKDYYARVKASPRAKRVKLSDIRDNADPQRLAKLDDETRERLTAKYATAREALK